MALKWKEDGESTKTNLIFAQVMFDMGVGVEVCRPFPAGEGGQRSSKSRSGAPPQSCPSTPGFDRGCEFVAVDARVQILPHQEGRSNTCIVPSHLNRSQGVGGWGNGYASRPKGGQPVALMPGCCQFVAPDVKISPGQFQSTQKLNGLLSNFLEPWLYVGN